MSETKPERFFRDRATTVRNYAERLSRLEQQEDLLRHTVSPFTAFAFYQNYDKKIYDETLKAYKSGLNADGIQFAFVTWLICMVVFSIPVLLFGARSRKHA